MVRKEFNLRNLALGVACLAAVSVFTSCGKKCSCTYYEDGKKLYVESNSDYRVFEKSVCEDGSEKPHQGLSIVTDGKEVTQELKCM